MVTLQPLAADELDRVERFWLALHAHHQMVAPELKPYVGEETSWHHRRAFYEKVLAEGGYAVVAVDAHQDVGYSVVRCGPAPWPATFATQATVAELESVVVVESLRRRGVGSRMLDAFSARLDAAGVHDRLIGVVVGNGEAVKLYRRRGYQPTWLTLTRFQQLPPPTERSPIAISAVTPDEIGALKPLWLELHHHYQSIAPTIGRFVADHLSWATVRPLLTRAAETDILLRAGPSQSPRAFMWADVRSADSLWSDTWIVGRDIAEVHVLVTRVFDRGQGVGSALLNEFDRRLAERGVVDQVATTLQTNLYGIRLFSRRGFRPAWMMMTDLSRAVPSESGGRRSGCHS